LTSLGTLGKLIQKSIVVSLDLLAFKMKFIKAQVGPPLAGDPDSMFTVEYFDEKGNMTIRSRGSRAWRCNNPGNLHRSHYSMG